jgi:RNA polymerase sigma-70 factor (ECF subfamily)
MERMTDEALVAGIRRGDAGALAEVYHRYKGDVLALTVTILGRREGAYDMLHDVFVGLARNAVRLAPDSNLKGYLLTAAANRARDHRTRSARRAVKTDPPADLLPSTEEDPSAPIAKAEESARLWQAVASLPENQRVVVALHIHAGLTFKQIAQGEGLSENTVQSRYRYALEKLRSAYLGAIP